MAVNEDDVDTDTSAIVIDNGAYSVKCGFAGDFKYKTTFDSVNGCDSDSGKKLFADWESVDWKAVESAYKHLVCGSLQLAAQHESFKYLMTEEPNNSRKNRANSAKLMFESLNASGIYYGATPTMALYSTGQLTGLVIDSGYHTTRVSPIDNGYLLPLRGQRLDYGGATVTERLRSLLSVSDSKCVRSIKESVCRDSECLLPDGFEVKDMYDFMFESSGTNDCTDCDLQQCVHNVVSHCLPELQSHLYKHLVLSGGNTMFPAMARTVKANVSKLTPAYLKIRVHSSPQRDYATFTGASILASQSQMQHLWVTKDVYDECGADVLSYRCF